MHVYVQKCTSTTLPRKPAGVTGWELSQVVAPAKSGRSPSIGRSSAKSGEPEEHTGDERRHGLDEEDPAAGSGRAVDAGDGNADEEERDDRSAGLDSVRD